MFRMRTAAMALGVCSALAGCGSTPGEPAGAEGPEGLSVLATGNTWTSKRSLSPWRQAMVAGTINGIIYVAGGASRLNALARVDAYNLSTDTWSTVASMPGARYFPNGATMINGKLYVAGGYNANGVSSRTLFVYDPGANTWSRKADIPQAGCRGAQGAIGGRLYVYTGCFALGNLGVFFRYDPATNAWLRRATPPLDHQGGVAGVINGKFYLTGGFDAEDCGLPTPCEFSDNRLHVYNPATDSWTEKAFAPITRDGMAAAVLGGKLYIAGGFTEGGIYETMVYDPATNVWTLKAEVPRVTGYGTVAVAGGKLVYVAGVDDQQPNLPGPSKVYAYTP